LQGVSLNSGSWLELNVNGLNLAAMGTITGTIKGGKGGRIDISQVE
jgi:hypothetical protein